MSFLKSQIAAGLRSIFVAIAVLQPDVRCVPQAATITGADVHTSALPDLSGPASSVQPCGGCYLVADVAGIVWYSEIFLNQAATAVVGVGVGNGTRATSTSIIENEVQFTFAPTMATAMGSPLAVTSVHYDSTVTVAGAILSSPTAYNVFSAYSVTSAYMSDGICVTSSGSANPIYPAYTETLASANGQVTLDAAGEQGLINSLGFTGCSPGGEAVSATALVQVKNLTSTTTTTFSSVSLAAAMSLAPTTTPAPTSSSASLTTLTSVLTTLTATLSSTTLTSTLLTSSTSTFSSSSLSTTSYASITNAPKIVYGSGSSTLTLNANPVGLPYVGGNITLTGSGTTVVVGPSGGNFSGGLVPFLGGAASFRDGGVGTSLWACAVVGLVAGIGVL